MIKSKDLAAMPYCFSLDYHMYGKGSGALEILAQEKDKAQILSENNIVKNRTVLRVDSKIFFVAIYPVWVVGTSLCLGWTVGGLLIHLLLVRAI